MIENPYDSPHAELSASAVPSPTGSRGVRLSVFFVNCFLLLLFPPTCCPCGFGPIGFIIQPYLILLGCPTIYDNSGRLMGRILIGAGVLLIAHLAATAGQIEMLMRQPFPSHWIWFPLTDSFWPH